MKKVIIFIICSVCLLPLVRRPVKAVEEEVSLRSMNAIVSSLNDTRVLYEKNSTQKIFPASMTKIMSALVAIENIKDMNATYTFTADVWTHLEGTGASLAGFQAGQTCTMQDLLYGVLLPSGADATEGLARVLFGDQDAFVEQMNAKADALSMKGTHFTNTSGLHEEAHYSTVQDISLLLTYALKNEVFFTMFTSETYVTSDGSMRLRSTFANQKGLVNKDTSMVVGSKTGYTIEGSQCLASYSEIGEEKIVMVSANTNSDASYPYHIDDVAVMDAYLKESFHRVEIVRKKQKVAMVKLPYGQEEKYDLTSAQTVSRLVKKTSEIKRRWVGKESIDPPVYKDTYLGEWCVYEGDTLLYKKKFYAPRNVEVDTLSYYLAHPWELVQDNFILLLGVGAIAFHTLTRKYILKKKS